MRNTIIIATISLLVLGCSKDKFSSTPTLKFKSVNTKELRKFESLQLKLSFTDLEGDLQDSIYVEKVRLTKNCPGEPNKVYYQLPPFPTVKNSEGDIIISYTYGSGGPFLPIAEILCSENDTCLFRFVLQDQAKHKSDTVSSDIIVLIK